MLILPSPVTEIIERPIHLKRYMHPAWSLIKSFYCLNLDKNQDRWDKCVDEFRKVGISYVERIITQESEENRYLSFNQAHYNAIKKGYETGEPFCIFEDDVAFDMNWKRIEESTAQLPQDWALLYIGANIVGTDTVSWKMPDRVSANIARMYNAWMTHAIVYSPAMAKWIIDNFDPMTFPVYDEWLRINVMSAFPVYVTNPMFCYQRPVYSDVWQREVDYTGAHLQGNDYLKYLV